MRTESGNKEGGSVTTENINFWLTPPHLIALFYGSNYSQLDQLGFGSRKAPVWSLQSKPNIKHVCKRVSWLLQKFRVYRYIYNIWQKYTCAVSSTKTKCVQSKYCPALAGSTAISRRGNIPMCWFPLRHSVWEEAEHTSVEVASIPSWWTWSAWTGSGFQFSLLTPPIVICRETCWLWVVSQFGVPPSSDPRFH